MLSYMYMHALFSSRYLFGFVAVSVVNLTVFGCITYLKELPNERPYIECIRKGDCTHLSSERRGRSDCTRFVNSVSRNSNICGELPTLLFSRLVGVAQIEEPLNV